MNKTMDKFVVLFSVYNMSHLYEPEMNASQVKLTIIKLFKITPSQTKQSYNIQAVTRTLGCLYVEWGRGLA